MERVEATVASSVDTRPFRRRQYSANGHHARRDYRSAIKPRSSSLPHGAAYLMPGGNSLIFL
jgi:hypothetical protein